MMKLLETHRYLTRQIDRFVIARNGMTEESIKREIKEIINKPYYLSGMALYTFNGDSQRYWKLRRYLDSLN